ncbi:MAG: hypothetical protein IJQ56_00090 [Synergistaceae bacterium]|nr:hypothetical protein [Synergistaceae bacterium]
MNDKITFRLSVSCLFAIAGSLSLTASLWHIWRLLSCLFLNEINSESIMYYGTRAGVFAVFAVLLYAIFPERSKSKLPSKCAFLSLSLGLMILLFRTDRILALISLVPLILGFIAMAMMASRAVNSLILPMTVFAFAVNSSLIFLVAAGIFRGLWYGVSPDFMMNFLLASITAPLISASLVRSAGHNVKHGHKAKVLSEQSLVKLYVSSLACAFQDFALMLQTGLAYSFVMFMLVTNLSGSKFPDKSALFYLGAVLICAMLLLLSTWFQYTAFALYRDYDKDADTALARLIGSCIFLLFMSLPLLYIDWRMTISALWVLPVTFLLSRVNVFISVSPLILRLAPASTVLTGALLFSQGKLTANVFLLFIMTVSKLYDPLEIALSTRTGD